MGREKNLSESLRYIYEHKGIDTFLNEKIIYAMLMDLMPKNSKEVNWVIDAINSQAIKPLIEAEKNNLNKEECKQKARKIFEENEINESRITYLLNCFSYGLKWTDKVISLKEIKNKEKKAQEEKVKSNINTKKNENIKINKNDDVKNIKKETYSKKNINDKNTKQTQQQKNKKQPQQPQVTQSQLSKLEFEYNTLFNEIDRIIQSNNNYITNLKPVNMFFSCALNVMLFFVCLAMMISYLLLLKDGYIFKRILILDIVGFILGIKIIKNNFNNLKKLRNDLFIQETYKKYINLKGDVSFNQTQLKKGVVKTYQKYNEYINKLKVYRDEYAHINHEYGKVLQNVNNEKTKMAIPIAVFCLIFIISGVYESRLIYDRDNLVNDVSRSIVKRIYSQVYEPERACIKTDFANVRRKADKNSEQVAVIEKREIVYLTGKSYEKDGKIWYEVNGLGSKGWISGTVLVVVPNTLTVSEKFANIRARANLDSKVEYIAKRGTRLYTTGKAIEKSDRIWYEVYQDGKSGYWISSNVVE